MMKPFSTGRMLMLASIACAEVAMADHDVLEEVQVIGRSGSQALDVATTPAPEVDATALLRKLPGANINGNGPLSGIAQYRGMYGNRVAVEVDGAHFASGGPNLMDPPLHYAPATILETLTVYRGAAPVSAAQESIGGLVVAKTRQGEFNTKEQWSVNGGLLGSGQTVNNGLAGSALVAVANDRHKFHISGLAERADDADFGDGVISPSEYQRSRVDLGYALQLNHHSFEIAAARNETGDTGTPALPMDIVYIDSDLYRGRYRFDNGRWALEASLHGNEVEHLMSNNELRPARPGRALRENLATGDALGYRVLAEFFSDLATWRLGSDGQFDVHNSDISDPSNAAFFVTNFNDASRDVLGAFAEAEFDLSPQWELLAGLRYNQVMMDADEVGSSMAMMKPMVGALAKRFNEADRSSTDRNVDWVLRADWSPSDGWRYTGAVSRKTRSAAYQEKFLWLPLQATGGLADGRNYVGDLELKPEVAHEAELGFDWQNQRVTLAPRVFYRVVDDYIQGTPSADSLVNRVSMAMGNPNAPLQFSNVEATLYGFDMNWGVVMDEHWSLYGLVNYVRGKRDDLNDDLYRIAAPNSTLGVDYRRGSWHTALEGVAYVRQTMVSDTNGETETPGYAVLNLYAQVTMLEQLSLSAGINNLLDRTYRDHLAGTNRAINDDIALGDKLPGWGRNLYASVRWDF